MYRPDVKDTSNIFCFNTSEQMIRGGFKSVLGKEKGFITLERQIYKLE
jgi:hypothetical protein